MNVWKGSREIMYLQIVEILPGLLMAVAALVTFACKLAILYPNSTDIGWIDIWFHSAIDMEGGRLPA